MKKFGERRTAAELCLLGGLAAISGSAFAQIAPAPDQVAPSPSVAASGVQVYPADFFARYAPKTAADMVSQIPGFSIASSNSGDRGFGQANQNVLINGRRISSKTNDTISSLQQLTAASVERIELVDGATLKIPGLSGQVANIIAKEDALSGSWLLRPEFREDRAPMLLGGNASINGKSEGLSWTLSFLSVFQRNGHDGPERVTNAAGALTDVRIEDAEYRTELPQISGSLTYETLGGSVASINFLGNVLNQIADETSRRNPVGMPKELRLFDQGKDGRQGEIGADYDFAFGPGRLKLIGLERYTKVDLTALSRSYPGYALPALGQRFRQDSEEGESILRSEYSFGALGGDWQWALEGAFNYVDVRSGLADLQPDGSFIEQALPDATARVEEKRAETNVSYGRPLWTGWSLQSSLGVEYSELTQTGPTGKTRDFVRPKGFVSLNWKPDANLDLSFKAERRVGQLNFFDFIDSVNLQDQNAQAGNPDLVPQQSWELSLEANRKFGPWGALKVKLGRSQIEDLVDQIPIGSTGAGVGNIDSAEQWTTEITSTLNFDPLGWKGAKWDFHTVLGNSKVEDPLTRQERLISNSTVFQIDTMLRWDIPSTDWAISIGMEDYRNAAEVRLDQRGQAWTSPPTNYIFIENKNVFGLKAQMQLVNIGSDTHENFRRDVYNGRRTNGLLFTEDRRRAFGPILRFNFSGTF